MPDMPHSTRFYVGGENLGWSRLVWFREYKQHSMMLGFYGMSSEQESLAYEYGDELVSRETLRTLRINYRDAKPRKKLEIEHVTVHRSGRLHLKLRNRVKPYIHRVQLTRGLSNNAGEFLDMFIFSDVASKYMKTSMQHEPGSVVMSTQPYDMVVLRGRFSGVDFNLEKVVWEEEQLLAGEKLITFPAVFLGGKTLKGIFTWHLIDSRGIDLSKRPSGTYFLLAFPTVDGWYLVKKFIFN